MKKEFLEKCCIAREQHLQNIEDIQRMIGREYDLNLCFEEVDELLDRLSDSAFALSTINKLYFRIDEDGYSQSENNSIDITDADMTKFNDFIIKIKEGNNYREIHYKEEPNKFQPRKVRNIHGS